MSKIKTLITPLVQAQLKPIDQPQQGFMASLSKLAEPFIEPATPSDPVERMRAKFTVNAEVAIQEIRSGAEKIKWFRKLPNGKFVVSFRNANSAMSLNGAKEFQVADADAAAWLLEASKAAATLGELDSALKATQRTPPTRKKKADEPQSA